MPLPIETPAPKASSLIKRFQQNIDQSDEKPIPPLPKQRLSIGPDDPAYRRRSWAVGSGGAALPQTEVLWRGRQPSSGSASGYSNTSSPQLHASPTSRVVSSLNQDGSPSQIPASQLGKMQVDPTLSLPLSSRLETIPPTPIDQSMPMPIRPNLSTKNSEHSSIHSNTHKSSVHPTEVLSRTNSPTKARLTKTSATPSALDQPDFRPRAAVLAEIRAPRTRKVTNVTAPTAASLAKIRSADGSHTPPSVVLSSPVLRGRTDSLTRNNSSGQSLAKVKPESIIGNQSPLGLSPSKSITRKAHSPLGKGPHPAARRPTTAQPQSSQRTPSSPSRPSTNNNERMRAASSAPKSRTRVDSIGSATTNINPAKKAAAASGSSTVKSKPSPPVGLPPFGAGPGLRAQAKSPTPRKARTNLSHFSSTTPAPTRPAKASVTPTSHPTKPETRPASRARVASIATPVSIKRPTTSAPKPRSSAVTTKTGTSTNKMSEGEKTPKTPTGQGGMKSGTTTKPSSSSNGRLATPSQIPIANSSLPKSSTDSKTPKGSKSAEELNEASLPEPNKAVINTLEFPSIPDEIETNESPKATVDDPSDVSQLELVNAVESLKMREDTEENPEEITYQSDQIDIEVITNETSSTEEGSCNTDEPLIPNLIEEKQPNQMIANEDENVTSVQIPLDASIHIAAESSTGSINESLEEKEVKKKRSKRRSGIAAW